MWSWLIIKAQLFKLGDERETSHPFPDVCVCATATTFRGEEVERTCCKCQRETASDHSENRVGCEICINISWCEIALSQESCSKRMNPKGPAL